MFTLLRWACQRCNWPYIYRLYVSVYIIYVCTKCPMLDPSLSVATKRSFYSTEVEYQWFYHIIYNIAKC